MRVLLLNLDHSETIHTPPESPRLFWAGEVVFRLGVPNRTLLEFIGHHLVLPFDELKGRVIPFLSSTIVNLSYPDLFFCIHRLLDFFFSKTLARCRLFF